VPTDSDVLSHLKMADPFQLEIIRSNPIGQRLHAFDRSFRSACSKLGISVSADAVPQVVKNGENIELARRSH